MATNDGTDNGVNTTIVLEDGVQNFGHSKNFTLTWSNVNVSLPTVSYPFRMNKKHVVDENKPIIKNSININASPKR